jgi:regulator of protease activity HflC (stomatin/prohibitin superfamily)
METTVVILALLALTLLTLFKGVRQVPQGSKWVVQRLGKYHSHARSRASTSSSLHRQRGATR